MGRGGAAWKEKVEGEEKHLCAEGSRRKKREMHDGNSFSFMHEKKGGIKRERGGDDMAWRKTFLLCKKKNLVAWHGERGRKR